MKLDRFFIKKLTAWLIISSCSLLLLGFAWILILFVKGYLEGNPNLQIPTASIIGAAGGFTIICSVLVFGIIGGLRKLRRDKPRTLISFPDKLNIVLRGKIEYNDYRNLILTLTFMKPVYFLVIAIVLLFALGVLTSPGYISKQHPSHYFIFVFLAGILLLPFTALSKIKKIYRKNKIFHEPLEYFLSNESIGIKGDTVDTLTKWPQYHKIQETKRFFVLYQGQQVSALLDKRMFTPEELATFRRFIRSLKLAIE